MLTLTSLVDAEEHGDDTIDIDGEITTRGPIVVALIADIRDVNIYDEWMAFRQSAPLAAREQSDFVEWMRTRLVDDYEADDIRFCADCSDPTDEDDLIMVKGDDEVCDSCVQNYAHCNHCEQYVDPNDIYTTLDDEEICDSCRDYNYYYCEHCDGYYHPDSEYHEHDDDCDCEAPAQTFRIRNDGNDPLRNDESLTISLPAGVISDEGIGAISRLIRTHADRAVELPPYDYGMSPSNQPEYMAAVEERQKWYNLAYSLADLGRDWQTKQGNFTKRLSRHAYKNHGLKVPTEVLSEVGNLGSQHSQGSEVTIEVTRNLNLPAAEFAHEESCWWQSYHSSRCALKSNGGFGLRSFGEHTNYWGHTTDGVKGRAWVLPMRLTDDGGLTPTFETESPDALVVFNGYGDLSGYTPTRILAHLYGMTYRKVAFSCDPMYVNGDSGYLIGPEELVKDYTDGHIYMSVDEHANLHSREESAGLLSTLVSA